MRMSSEICEIVCTASGKVQRVMYRDFVQRKARAFGVRGFVENLDGRAVRVVAQGTQENLELFIEQLHKGPFMAQVARVDVSWREPVGSFVGFKIKAAAIYLIGGLS